MSQPAVTTQDYANVALGAIAMAATFMVGKIAVDSVLAARKKSFSKKGQPPAAVKAKESTLDGVMKVAATAFSVWQLTQEFPELVAQVKALSK